MIASAWDELSAEEQERLWGLSADLYQLLGQEKLEPPSESDGPRELLVSRIGEAMRSARDEAAARASNYAQDGEADPDLLFKSADVLLATALDSPASEIQGKCRQVIDVLKTAIRRQEVGIEIRGGLGLAPTSGIMHQYRYSRPIRISARESWFLS